MCNTENKMKKIFIINGAQTFDGSGGGFNSTLAGWSQQFFENKGYQVKVTHIDKPYKLEDEVSKYVWADLIIYHTPVWWFHLPYKFKEYIDHVFEAGHENGIYKNDGRSRSRNPKLHYGTGGSLSGKYMLTTTWNAPEEAFPLEGEFFEQQSVDDVFIGVHKMNQFIGLSKVEGYHFFGISKEAKENTIDQIKADYLAHLEKIML